MVSILLSTYNGELYLNELINSILNQSYSSWELFIRDDGSKDSTNIIIDTYCVKYPEKIFRIPSFDENVGSGKSFMKLLESVDSDYYMFCDQDDIWLNNKIELSMKKMEELESCEKGKAIAVFTDLKVVDEKLNLISDSLWKYSNISAAYSKDFYRMLAWGCPAYGCTMLFNSKVKQYVLPFPEWKFHDLWTILIISKKGIVDYISFPTILYRQHTCNVTGAHQKNNKKYYPSRFLHMNELIIEQRKLFLMYKDLPFNISLVKIFILKMLKLFK